MPKTIAMIGAIARHRATFEFLQGCLAENGLAVMPVDPIETRNHEIVAAYPMQGLANLYARHQIHGAVGIAEGDELGRVAEAMRLLPLGFPKFLLSSALTGDVSQYVGTKDLFLIPSMLPCTDLNSLTRRILGNAAGMTAGAAKMPPVISNAEKPLIVASMYGNTTPAVTRAQRRFEEAGFDVLIFHASGTGGRTMESLISDGLAAACFDFTTTELIDYVAGGVMSAGPDRLMAAARRGIPTILVPGCIDQIVFHSVEQMPPEYRARNLYQWNPNVTLMRSNAAECRKVGEMMARAANAHASPHIAILLPLGGTSMLDIPGGPYWDPDADRACFETIQQLVKPSIPVYEIDAHINHPAFVDKAIEVFFNLLTEAGKPQSVTVGQQ